MLIEENEDIYEILLKLSTYKPEGWFHIKLYKLFQVIYYIRVLSSGR